jgi:hypothetical protein
MYKIKVQKRAIKSITKTVLYISNDNIFYANQVQDYIYKSIKLLEDFPFLWVDKWNWYRQIVEPKYKFKVIYKIYWTTIYVVCVLFRDRSLFLLTVEQILI